MLRNWQVLTHLLSLGPVRYSAGSNPGLEFRGSLRISVTAARGSGARTRRSTAISMTAAEVRSIDIAIFSTRRIKSAGILIVK